MGLLERNFVHHAVACLRGRYRPYRPLCAYVYLTFRCNLACVYCNDGTGTKYPDAEDRGELDAAGWQRVLEVLRRETDVLIVTGGEPTMRSDLPEILAGARRLGFRTISVLTNAVTVDRHPEVTEHATMIMVSLDTMDHARGDHLMGAPEGTHERILRNVDRLIEERRRRGFRLYFNVCITPDNVADVHDVIDFALERRVGFTPLPEVVGVHPREGLRDNDAYRGLVDRIVALKRAGADILGTLGYLGGIRDFDHYDCLPTLLARVWPDGSLMYPCQKLHKVGGNLHELGDYDAAVDEGIRRHGDLPRCADARCHVGCYMDFSMAVQRPSLLLREAWCRLHGPFFRPDRWVSR